MPSMRLGLTLSTAVVEIEEEGEIDAAAGVTNTAIGLKSSQRASRHPHRPGSQGPRRYLDVESRGVYGSRQPDDRFTNVPSHPAAQNAYGMTEVYIIPPIPPPIP